MRCKVRVMRGWVGVQFPEKKRFVTLEWPLTLKMLNLTNQREIPFVDVLLE